MSPADESSQALDPHSVETKLSTMPEWDADTETGTLSRAFVFRDFDQSMNFANAVAVLAREADHHPDMLVSYDTVTIVLTTHSAGGITDKDFMLAQRIDRLPEASGRVMKNEPFLAD